MKSIFYFDCKPDTKRYQEYSMNLHKRKLEDIKSYKQNSINSSETETIKIKKSKKISNLRNNDIYRENQILLCKLISLSEERLNMPKIRYEKSHPKSMNTLQRRRAAEKISKANRDIANRIASMPSSFQVKKFEKEYIQHIGSRSKLRKNEVFSQIHFKKIKNKAISSTPSRDNYLPSLSQRDIKTESKINKKR